MGFMKKIRDGLMGADYDDRDDEGYDYEEYDEQDEEIGESKKPSFLASLSLGGRDKGEKATTAKKNRSESSWKASRTDSDYDNTYDLARSSQRTSKRASLDSGVLNLPSSNNYRVNAEEIVLCRPETLEDARPVCEYLKNNVICVINLESVDRAIAQRIADFLSGACDALDGGIQRVSHDIFLIAPNNVAITSHVKEELKKNGVILPWIQSALR